MPFQRKYSRLCIVLVATGALLVLILSYASRESRIIRNIRSHVIEASSLEFPILDLAEATDFQWDSVFIFAPYTSETTIEAALFFSWPEAKNTGIPLTDGANLLVFVKDGDVVNHVMYPRRYGDLAGAAGKYPRANARFLVIREGHERLVLKHEAH